MPFEPGYGGRKPGSRNRLAKEIFDEVLAFIREPSTSRGTKQTKLWSALENTWRSKPDVLLRFLTTLLPKEIDFSHNASVSELDDSQIDELLAVVKQLQQSALVGLPAPRIIDHVEED